MKTPDGYTLTVSGSAESMEPVAALTGAPTSREYLVDGSFTGSVTGSGGPKLAGGSLEAGYQIGCGISQDDIENIMVPPKKPYSQLTPEEKRLVKSQYYSMADADEPPYPVNGPQTIFEAIRDIQRKLGNSGIRVSGTLSVFVDVDYKGKATAIEVEESPDPQMTKAAAAVLMLQKYKPAECKGSPCNMQYPFRIEFKRGV